MSRFSEDDSAYATDPTGQNIPVNERVNWNPPPTAGTRAAATQTRMQRQQQERMAEAAREFQEQQQRAIEETRAQYALMNEARVRFAKASLYEQILEGSVFEGSNDPVTAEVNAEFREFAQKQLCALLGIKSDLTDEPKLDSEQVEVLAMFANSLLQRKESILKKDEAKPAEVIARTPPPPPEVGQLATKRTRTPVVRKAPMPQQPSAAARPPVVIPAAPMPQQMTLPLEGAPQQPHRGIAQVIPPPTANVPKPAPMPSEDMQIALAAEQGENGLRNLPRIANELAKTQ